MNPIFSAGTAARAIFAALFFFAAAPSQAQWRYVVVNGQQLHPLQVEQLERLYCSPIANGRYWYNTRTGVWGYEGDPRPQGKFVYRCGWRFDGSNRRSLSERGLLYSTNEILRGRP
jgi:hypothetical protein